MIGTPDPDVSGEPTIEEEFDSGDHRDRHQRTGDSTIRPKDCAPLAETLRRRVLDGPVGPTLEILVPAGIG